MEDKIVEAEGIEEEISEKTSQLSVLINADPTMSIFSTVSSDISDTGPSIPNTTLNNPSSSQTPPSLIPTSTQSHVLHSRLPKLTLPTFSGDSLEWLSFWDSFDAAVNKKYGLSDIEKFNYLRVQLTGEAERAIGGFPLTSGNYAIIRPLTLCMNVSVKVLRLSMPTCQPFWNYPNHPTVSVV